MRTNRPPGSRPGSEGAFYLPIPAGLMLAALLLIPLALSGAVPGPALAGYPWLYLRDNRLLWAGEKLAEVVLVGDVMLGRGVAGQPAPLASVAPWLQAADLVVGNFEGVLADQDQIAGAGGAVAGPGPITLLVPPDRAVHLRRAGFDLLGLANNHALDLGPQGLAGTYRQLHAAGIAPLGAGPDAEAAWQPVFRTVKGVRLAFLAFNGVPDPLATGSGWAPAWSESPAQVTEALHRAREQAEAVIVSVHWGYEYQEQVDPGQLALAQTLLEAGADLVVGHHPHVVQAVQTPPLEMLGSDSRYGVVAFSLGNFAFDQYQPEARHGLALRAFFDRQGLRAVQALPVLAGDRPRLLQQSEASEWARRVLSPARLGFECSPEACWQVHASSDDRNGIFHNGTLDLTGDGRPEGVRLVESRAVISHQGKPVWQSPAEWHVRDLALGDPNDDGRGELLLAVDKADAQGTVRSHPFIVGQRGGQYRLLWGGSAVSAPILEVALGDVDGDGAQELVVLEEAGRPGWAALAVWDWHGWGFSLKWRSSPGPMRDLGVSWHGTGAPAKIGVSSGQPFQE